MSRLKKASASDKEGLEAAHLRSESEAWNSVEHVAAGGWGHIKFDISMGGVPRNASYFLLVRCQEYSVHG